jgi:GAF domain-containing protein
VHRVSSLRLEPLGWSVGSLEEERPIVADEVPEHEALLALARFMVGDVSVQDTLQRIVDLSAVAVPPATYCGVTMLVDDKVTTSVASDPEVRRIDQAQYDAGSGPCLDAFRDGEVHVVPSTEKDRRWPEFSATALEHGIRSTLSLPMRAGATTTGALNLYSIEENGFSEDDHRRGEAFATQAAVVVSNAQAYWDARSLSENLTEAMRSRATIEQAKGVLMASSDVGPEDAFDLLRRASQRENRKLREIAEEVVGRYGTRSRPGGDGPGTVGLQQ